MCLSALPYIPDENIYFCLIYMLSRILSLSKCQTYGCLAISLLSMALSFPESRDMTADSIVAITINLQLIVVVNISLELLIVSDQLLVQKVCSELSQTFTHLSQLSSPALNTQRRICLCCMGNVHVIGGLNFLCRLVFLFFQRGEGSD